MKDNKISIKIEKIFLGFSVKERKIFNSELKKINFEERLNLIIKKLILEEDKYIKVKDLKNIYFDDYENYKKLKKEEDYKNLINFLFKFFADKNTNNNNFIYEIYDELVKINGNFFEVYFDNSKINSNINFDNKIKKLILEKKINNYNDLINFIESNLNLLFDDNSLNFINNKKNKIKMNKRIEIETIKQLKFLEKNEMTKKLITYDLINTYKNYYRKSRKYIFILNIDDFKNYKKIIKKFDLEKNLLDIQNKRNKIHEKMKEILKDDYYLIENDVKNNTSDFVAYNFYISYIKYFKLYYKNDFEDKKQLEIEAKKEALEMLIEKLDFQFNKIRKNKQDLRKIKDLEHFENIKSASNRHKNTEYDLVLKLSRDKDTALKHISEFNNFNYFNNENENEVE